MDTVRLVERSAGRGHKICPDAHAPCFRLPQNISMTAFASYQFFNEAPVSASGSGHSP